MYISKVYNAKLEGRRTCNGRSKYWREHEEVHDFLASDNENVVLGYDNERDAKNAFQGIYNYVKCSKSPVRVSVYQKKNIVLTKKQS